VGEFGIEAAWHLESSYLYFKNINFIMYELQFKIA
jgi:hypothetical protein